MSANVIPHLRLFESFFKRLGFLFPFSITSSYGCYYTFLMCVCKYKNALLECFSYLHKKTASLLVRLPKCIATHNGDGAMKQLSEIRIFKIISIIFSMLGFISLFVPFPELSASLKVILIGACVLISLILWIVDAQVEIFKLKKSLNDMKKATLEIEKNRKYLSEKVATQQRKIDAFRHEWNIIQICISSHTIRDEKVEFEHLKAIYSASTTTILNTGGFTDDDESESI